MRHFLSFAGAKVQLFYKTTNTINFFFTFLEWVCQYTLLYIIRAKNYNTTTEGGNADSL